jgi:ubiquinol-cytochrome c reductase cytochrome b subunit
MHQNGASLFFIAVYMHIFRGLYYGSYKAPREITWIIGMLIYLLMMGTAFMGYVLPWGQMSFWGATVITGLFGAIPFVGDAIQTWLLGGPAVDNATLNRFFSLHYLLPFVIAGLVILHIWAFHTTGNNNPTGCRSAPHLEEGGRADTLPFWPYFVIKDLFALAVILVAFFAIVGFMPNYLGHPDNYIEANPLVTPAHIVPEWYFLPFYAILRAFDGDVWVVHPRELPHRRHHRRQVLRRDLAMFGAIVVMALAPWLDTSSVRSGRYRPMFKWWFWLFVVDFFVLMWVGRPPAEGIYPYIALIGSAYWFAYFLVILPLLGVIEKPLPQPATIEEDFKSTTASPTAARAGQPHLPHRRPSDRKGRHEHVQKTCHHRSHRRRGRPSLGDGARRRGRRHVEDYSFSFEGPFGTVRPEPAAARPAGLYRGLLGLPRPALRSPSHPVGRRWPRPDRRGGARLYRDELHRGL